MPGKKIRVSIGDNGEIIGFHYVHPDLKDFEPYQAITEEEALEILKEKLGGEPEKLEVRREYYFGPEFIIQGFAQPYYIFDGTYVSEVGLSLNWPEGTEIVVSIAGSSGTVTTVSGSAPIPTTGSISEAGEAAILIFSDTATLDNFYFGSLP